ncbi:MAG: hypothetical protein JW748_07995 [Anaerolineales bacterium]|nr:hypothetical protein [Anaerolineales bacterium]
MPSLEKIRFLTVNYSRLQGLKAVPPGLLLFLVVLWSNGQKGPARDLTLPLIGLFATAVLYGLIEWYYRRTYGRVEQTRRAYWSDVILSTVFSLVALAAFAVDMETRSPVSLFALVFAASLFLDYFRMLRLAGATNPAIFPVGLLCIGEMALSAFLPLLDGPALAVFGFRSPLFLVYAVDGIIIMIYGVAGHLFLARSMPSAGEVPHGQSV